MLKDKEFSNFVNRLNISEGDILYVASDITQILLYYKSKKITFNPNEFIDCLFSKIGEKGTLLFPTFNWGFCRGETFDYNNTSSETGSLSKIALKRSDFLRTKHPIYSFVVKGNDKEKLHQLDDKSGWGKNSIFAYFHEKKAKNLFIGIDYKNGFTFDHYFEEKVGVDYRYFKKFRSRYISKDGAEEYKTYEMYVRDLDLNIVTGIDEKLDDVLVKNLAYEKFFFKKIYFGLVDMGIAGDIMENDIKEKGGLIYAKKIT